MIAFQVLAVALFALLAAVTLAAAARRQLTRPAAAAWLVLWVAAAIAIARPGTTVVVAHWLGIGRGADLVFYCAIVAMFGGFFAVFVRFRRLEQQLTRIVRQLAIRDAVDPHGAPKTPDV